jgi:hypothetical protein
MGSASALGGKEERSRRKGKLKIPSRGQTSHAVWMWTSAQGTENEEKKLDEEAFFNKPISHSSCLNLEKLVYT